jgi:hypothetical protein
LTSTTNAPWVVVTEELVATIVGNDNWAIPCATLVAIAERRVFENRTFNGAVNMASIVE